MMKILMLNYEFPPLGGGAGNANFYLLKELSQYKDIHIDLITSSVGKYREENFSDNIKLFFLDIGKRKNLHYQTNKDLMAYAFKSYLFCNRLLKRSSYHLCHAFFGIPCGFIAMKLDLPYIISLRGSDVPFYNHRFYWWDRILFRGLSRKIWKRALRVIALSNYLKELARKTSCDIDMEVIYNGINCQEFYPDKDISEKEVTFNILFVGRLIERKGIIYLLQAFKEFAQKHKNSRLLIAGDGPLKNRLTKYCLRNKIHNNVQFLGIIGHDRINKLYQKSHIFVIPSLNEALGNVTHEALACGLPIITTDTGAAELLSGNGFIVKKKDAQAINQMLEKFLKNRDLVIQMGERSREIAQGMNWSNVAGKYYEIYGDIIKGHEKDK